MELIINSYFPFAVTAFVNDGISTVSSDDEAPLRPRTTKVSSKTIVIIILSTLDNKLDVNFIYLNISYY